MPTVFLEGRASGQGPEPGPFPVNASAARKVEPTRVVGTSAFNGLTHRVETYDPPDTSRKSFTRATLMK